MKIIQPKDLAGARFIMDVPTEGARDYVRWLIAQAATEQDGFGAALDTFKSRWPTAPNLAAVTKAAALPGATSGTWGSDLAPLDQLASEFTEYLRPLTVLGKLTGYRSVPFQVRVPTAMTGSTAKWVAERGATALSSMSFDAITLKPTKVAGMVVVTDELARFSSPSAESVITADLAAGVAMVVDQSLLDPTLPEVPQQSPASITYGAPTVASVGSTAAAAKQDLKALLALVTTNLAAPHFVMTRRTAIDLAAMGDAFPNVGANGGAIWGITVVVSDAVPSDGDSPGDGTVVLVDAADLLVADGGVDIRVTRQAAVQMDTAPDSPATGSTTLVSLWQHNLVGFLVQRMIHWKMRRSGSVAVLTGVRYSAE